MAGDPQSLGQVQEFLLVLRRRRWQIVLPALFILTLGSVFAVIVPKKYIVTTEVEVREGPRSETDPVLRNPQGLHALREIVNVLSHIKQHKRIEEVVEEQGDLWDEYVKFDDRERFDFIEEIRSNVIVIPPRKATRDGSEFVEVRYSDVDGHRAELFLRALVRSWIDFLVEWDREDLKNERDALQGMVNDGTTEYNAVSAAYTELARTMEIDPNAPLYSGRDASRDPILAMRDSVESDKMRTEVQIREAEATYLQARTDREEAPPVIGKEITDDGITYRKEIAGWEHQIQLLRLQQADYKPAYSGYRRIEEEVRKLQIQIEQAKALNIDPEVRFETTPNPILVELDRAVIESKQTLGALEAKRAALGEQLADLAVRSARRVEQYRELRDYHDERSLLRGLLDEKRIELDHKISALLVLQDAYSQPYEIVKRAMAKKKPETPNPWIIVAASVLAGLGVGLGLALLAEYARNSYRTAGDVAGMMAVPVLGAIHTIVTTAQARRAQLRSAVIGLSSAVILGGLVWFTWIWATAPERLPTEIRQAIDEFRRTLM
jgi:capsular polysaccharide biosynthesis protein